jgi:hypothetical protein
MDFTTASQEIQDLVTKRNQIIKKAAGIMADAVKTRANSGRLDNRTKQVIANMLKGFSDEESVAILTEAIVSVAGFSMTNNNGNSRRSGSIF